MFLHGLLKESGMPTEGGLPTRRSASTERIGQTPSKPERRVVRILLECFLVLYCFWTCKYQLNLSSLMLFADTDIT